MEFKDVKVNDKLLVERSNYNDRNYNVGVVTKVTATRFTVEVGKGAHPMVFTKDGREYPRATGYGRAYVRLKQLDAEGELLIKKSRMANKARHLAYKLAEIFENANFREKITSMDLEAAELDESIQLLEQTYERFKKYGPKDDGT